MMFGVQRAVLDRVVIHDIELLARTGRYRFDALLAMQDEIGRPLLLAASESQGSPAGGPTFASEADALDWLEAEVVRTYTDSRPTEPPFGLDAYIASVSLHAVRQARSCAFHLAAIHAIARALVDDRSSGSESPSLDRLAAESFASMASASVALLQAEELGAPGVVSEVLHWVRRGIEAAGGSQEGGTAAGRRLLVSIQRCADMQFAAPTAMREDGAWEQPTLGVDF